MVKDNLLNKNDVLKMENIYCHTAFVSFCHKITPDILLLKSVTFFH